MNEYFKVFKNEVLYHVCSPWYKIIVQRTVLYHRDQIKHFIFKY
jgi:hypothetical protein